MSTGVSSQLNAYRIADFLEWSDKKLLILNPSFQRRSVWTEAGKVYLIDSILRQVSLPKFYIRTSIDLSTRQSIREVVDGQQRLRAILDFANDKLTLTQRAGDLKGYRYSTLPSDLQEIFLNYNLSVEQLVNATDNDVLAVFARLNSYGTTLNPAENRHAEFQGDFKWSVHELASRNAHIFEDYNIIGLRDRVRMADDAMFAELYGILLNGVTDGGETSLKKLYRTYDDNFLQKDEVEGKVQACLEKIIENYSQILDSPLGRRPQFIMLFAAVAHSLYSIPSGAILDMPNKKALTKPEQGREALLLIAAALEADDESVLPKPLLQFRTASRSSTQRISSRRVRFPVLYNAITKS
jgi:hypothetical protein